MIVCDLFLFSHLNGKYYQDDIDSVDANCWYPTNSLKTIKMMVRPLGNWNVIVLYTFVNDQHK